MTTVCLSLGEQDLQRIADAVVARLELRTERRWLTVKGASEYAGLSEEAIRTAAKRGKLRGHKGESGRLVFRTEDVDAFMASPGDHQPKGWE